MSDSGVLRQLFPFNPAGFNPIAGVKLFAFALVAGAITIFTDLNLVVVIIGALLAWLTDVPGTTINRVAGMAIYGVASAVLVMVATSIDDVAIFTAAMVAVAFVATLGMAVSSRGFMVGWAVIITFIQATNMTGSAEPWTTPVNQLVGAGLVVLMTLVWPKGTGPWGSSGNEPPPESGGNKDFQFVAIYAATVAVVLGIAAFIGMQQFDFGVQMAATSAFMVLGPTTQQKWITAAGRAVAVVVGIVLSFFLITAIDSLEVLTIVWAIFPAIAIATLGVSYALAIGAYTTQMMMTIVLLGGDYTAFALDSNNRIIAEAIGIGLAIAAALFLEWWARQREVTEFAQPEMPENDAAATSDPP